MIFFPLSHAQLLHEIIITIPTHKKELVKESVFIPLLNCVSHASVAVFFFFFNAFHKKLRIQIKQQ